MAKQRKQRPILFSRMDEAEMDRARALADRLYDGNLSMLVRIAVREKIDRELEVEAQKERAA